MRAPAALVMLACAACAPQQLPAPVTVAPTPVHAPFAATWNAVIDVLASQNIPISTMERASGFVATAPPMVGRDGKAWAECGNQGIAHLDPDRATYNVRVRETGDSSTVQATVRFTSGSGVGFDLMRECSTKGVWEQQFAEAVKAHAEGVAVGQHE
jgi:hypothetical protein